MKVTIEIDVKYAIGEVVYMYSFFLRTIYKCTIAGYSISHNNNDKYVMYYGNSEGATPEDWVRRDLDELTDYLDKFHYTYNKLIF